VEVGQKTVDGGRETADCDGRDGRDGQRVEEAKFKAAVISDELDGGVVCVWTVQGLSQEPSSK
jgi:hypothetical protein